MNSIFLKDNNTGTDINENQINSLNKIANKPIGELLKKYPDLLVFPDSFSINNDDIDKNKIFTLLSDKKLYTHNIMGFIGVDDLSLTIGSRFDDDKKQYFLQYILSKVFAINLVNFNATANNEDIWDFLLFFLFTSYLNKAIKQGILKKYVKNKYNNSNIKGNIDISRHIKSNIPFLGNIAFTTREFSYNNDVIQLIRHTIEYIATSNFSRVLNNNSYTITNIRKIKEITNNYKKNNRLKIIHKNLKKVNHPYFTEYEPLRKLCLKILRKEGLSYRQEKEEVNGILFDGAWLWEEYLNLLLKSIKFIHPENKTGKKAIHIFSDNRKYKRFPDFYYKNGSIVIDAKYKMLDYSNVDRNDIHQLISYLYILKAEKGFILFPSKNNESEIVKIGLLNGYGGSIYKHNFKIPQKVDTFKEYRKKMKVEEFKLIKEYKKHIGITPPIPYAAINVEVV